MQEGAEINIKNGHISQIFNEGVTIKFEPFSEKNNEDAE